MFAKAGNEFRRRRSDMKYAKTDLSSLSFSAFFNSRLRSPSPSLAYSLLRRQISSLSISTSTLLKPFD